MPDFHSGHDLSVCEFEPHIGLAAVSTEPALDPLYPILSAPPVLVLSLSLKNKINIKIFFWSVTWSRREQIWPFAMVLWVSTKSDMKGTLPSAGWVCGAYPVHLHLCSKSQFLKSKLSPKVWGISRMWNVNFSKVSFTWCFIPPTRKFSSNPVRKVFLSLFYKWGRWILEQFCLFQVHTVIRREQRLGQTDPLMWSPGLSHNAHPLSWLKMKLSQNEIKYCFLI